MKFMKSTSLRQFGKERLKLRFNVLAEGEEVWLITATPEVWLT
jgi:hypothetical protein